jgi:uncharacterized protein (TIRG00374 family)
MKISRKWILLAITIVILAILFLSVDFPSAVDAIRKAEWRYLAIATAISFVFPFLCAIRWNVIVLQLGVHLGLWESFKIIMAAWPMGAVTPAKSGDLVKLLFLKNVLPYSKTTGVILAERLMDVIALCCYAVIWGLIYQFETAATLAGLMLIGVLVFLLLAASPLVQKIPVKWRTLVLNLFEATKKMVLQIKSFVLILAITFLNWFCTFLQIWLCYQAFHVDVPFFYIMAALPIAIFIGLLPITLSGMGTRDSAVIFLFREFAPYEVNLAVGILYSIFGYWLLSLLGIPFMRAAFGGSIGGIKGEDLKQRVFEPQPDVES